MSVNKFENQVQQKMDELRLQPSAQVWEEVERRIREKKRRRIIVFWFLFAGLLLSGGAWWMLDEQSRNKIAVVTEKKDVHEILKPVQTVNEKGPENKNQKTNANEPITSSQSEKINTPIIKQPDERKRFRTKENSIISPQLKPGEKNNPVKTKEKEPADIKSDVTDVQMTVKDEQVQTKKQDELITDKLVTSQQPIIAKEKREEKKDTINTQIADNAVEPVVQKKNQKKNKWKTSLSFVIGNTRLTEGIGSFGPKSLAYSSPGTGTSAGGGYQPGYGDSAALKGTNLQLGLFAKRKLGSKTAFSIGLDFSAYSTKQIIGSHKDSLLRINNDLRTLTSGGFYQTGNQSVYHNKYYYLQIPLSFHWQLNNGYKLPLEWQNGLAPSFLVSSNAVVYDRSNRIFYKDKRVFNTFNLVYETAFGARLFKDKKHPLAAGIYYNYHLTRLQKISPPYYNYLSSYGIRLNWGLKK